MNRVFLDCEFNGFGGELISLAMVTESGEEWYEVLNDEPVRPQPWVKVNVLPKLGKERVPATKFYLSFHAWTQLHCREAEIIADWPADFTHFNMIMDEVGRQLGFMLPMPYKMSLIERREEIITPELAHNALNDARALRDWYLLSPLSISTPSA